MWSNTRIAPRQDVRGNLHFSRFGVYGYWIVTPPDKPLADEAGLAQAAVAHWALADLLPFKPSFAGTSSLLDPSLVGDRMRVGVDSRFLLYDTICDAREAEVEATASRLPVYWIWARLDPHLGSFNPLHRAAQYLTEAGLNAPRPSQKNIDLYWAAMERMESMIPSAFRPMRPSPAQIRWLYRRQMTIGVVDKPIPLPGSTDSATTGFSWSPQVDVFEGPEGQEGSVPPLSAMCRVDSFDDQAHTSYQVHLGVASFPAGGIYFPGSKFTEIMSNLSDPETGERIHVDWWQRPVWLGLAKVNKENQSANRKIEEQYIQQSGRRSTYELSVSQEAVQAYEAELASGAREGEVQYTTVFSLGADSASKALRHYGKVRDALADLGVEIDARVGQQKRMFRAIRPGPKDKITDTFVQYTTRVGYSRYIPFTSTRAGDATGRYVGLNKLSGDLDPVFLNTRGARRQSQAGGGFYCGDPSGGKTYAAMTDAAEDAVSGSTVCILDSSGQWKKLAHKVPDGGSFDLARGEYTVDAMITNPGAEAAALMADVLCQMAGVGARSDIAADVRLLFGQRGGLFFTSVADALNFMQLHQDSTDDLRRFARSVVSWGTSPAAASIIGYVVNEQTGERRPMPAIDFDRVSMLVAETQGLSLPDENQSKAAASGLKELDAAQLIGLTVMNLFIHHLRDVFYSRKAHQDIIILEESWRLRFQKALSEVAFDVLRTGRWVNVDIRFISQKPWDDFEHLDIELASTYIFMFRVKASKMAAKAADFLGVDVERWPDIAKEITGLSAPDEVRDPFGRPIEIEDAAVPRIRRGECIARIGKDLVWMKRAEMVIPEWHEAADTTSVRV